MCGYKIEQLLCVIHELILKVSPKIKSYAKQRDIIGITTYSDIFKNIHT